MKIQLKSRVASVKKKLQCRRPATNNQFAIGGTDKYVARLQVLLGDKSIQYVKDVGMCWDVEKMRSADHDTLEVCCGRPKYAAGEENSKDFFLFWEYLCRPFCKKIVV